MDCGRSMAETRRNVRAVGRIIFISGRHLAAMFN